jgi:trk system potassium uptake protein TrkA
VTQAVELDATDERALRSIGIQDVDVAVVSIGENIESSLLVVMLLLELGAACRAGRDVEALMSRTSDVIGQSAARARGQVR